MNEKQLFGAKVAYYRKLRKLTQTQFAEKLSVTRLTISRIEKGVYFPSSDLLFKIAPNLGIKTYQLFDYQ